MIKKSIPTQKIIVVLLVLALTFMLGSCQAGGNDQPPSNDQSPVHAAGDFDLSDPSIGLSSLPGYDQTLTISTKGTLNDKMYDSNQSTTRTFSGSNELVKISETTTDNDPVDILYAIHDGYRYSVEPAVQSCQAAPMEDGINPLSDLSSRLPKVNGAIEIGSEEINGIAVKHYNFDEKNVDRQSGKNDSAKGDFWIAEEGGYLVKYELIANISSQDFTGTRSWSYALIPLIGDEAFQLPEPCQPVLADLPALQDAADIIMLPGFQQYLTNSTRTQVVEFYNESLPGSGWQTLPGSKPEEMDLGASIQTLAFTREEPSGETLLVIRVDEKDSSLRITAQTLTIKHKSQTESTETPSITDTPEIPPDQPAISLPDNLPAYPGAAVINQMDSFMLLESNDSIQNIASFYKEEMPGLDWSLDNEMDQAGITVQSWSNGEFSLVITLTENQGKVQIMFATRE